MKKTLSILLAVLLAFSIMSITASAAGSYSITLPTVAGKTRAVADINTNAVIEGDPATADFVIKYDSAVFTDISAIPAQTTFSFTVTLHEKYSPTRIFIFGNGNLLSLDPNGMFSVYMDRDIVITIPNTETYKNFSLKGFTIVRYKSSATPSNSPFSSTKGFKLYTYHLDNPSNAQTLQGLWGQDYYVKIICDKGYRACLKGIETAAEGDSVDIASLPIGLNISMDVEGEIIAVADLYQNPTTKAFYPDFYDNTYDDVVEGADYELVGRVYKIPGEYVKSDIKLNVQGVMTDTLVKVLTWLYRIIRVIANIIGHNV